MNAQRLSFLATHRSSDRTFYVPNVCLRTRKNHHLNFEEYASVLKSFHDAVLAMLSSEFTVVLVMEPPDGSRREGGGVDGAAFNVSGGEPSDALN